MVKIIVSHLLYGLQNMFRWKGVMSDALSRYKKQHETLDHGTKFPCLRSALLFIRTLSFSEPLRSDSACCDSHCPGQLEHESSVLFSFITFDGVHISLIQITWFFTITLPLLHYIQVSCNCIFCVAMDEINVTFRLWFRTFIHFIGTTMWWTWKRHYSIRLLAFPKPLLLLCA